MNTERIDRRFTRKSWKLKAASWKLVTASYATIAPFRDDVDQTRLRARLYLIAPSSGGSRRLPDFYTLKRFQTRICRIGF